MFGYIYKITNNINGKIYIGKREKEEFDESYWGSGKWIKNSLKKYGKENFSRSILEWCDSKEYLNKREKYWIYSFNSQDPLIGYNIAEGGQGGKRSYYPVGKDNPNYGHHHTEESKIKMSINKRNKIAICKDDVVKYISIDDLYFYLNKGWIRSNPNAKKSGFIFITNGVENKQIKKNELDDYIKQGFWKGRNYQPNKGKSFTADTREKMSKSSRGLRKNKIHVTNGLCNHMIDINELDFYISEGFWKGRTIHKNKEKN